jgi:hypothetical protein
VIVRSFAPLFDDVNVSMATKERGAYPNIVEASKASEISPVVRLRFGLWMGRKPLLDNRFGRKLDF